MENMKGKIVNCGTCGGEFDASLVRCPFCGTAYKPAAEEEYMDQLEDVREDLSQHTSDADHATGKLVRKSLCIAVIVAVIIAVLCFIVLVIPKSGSSHNEDELNSRKQVLIQGE